MPIFFQEPQIILVVIEAPILCEFGLFKGYLCSIHSLLASAAVGAGVALSATATATATAPPPPPAL